MAEGITEYMRGAGQDLRSNAGSDPEDIAFGGRCIDAAAEIERLRSAMKLVGSASALLDKNGMKPGWGVAKDLLHSAIQIADQEANQ
jgi:hypothetical protein